jgi:hypothetical protein
MTLTWALADSEVATVSAAGSELRLRCSAASLRRRTDTGERPTPGFGRHVVLTVRAARILGEQGPAIGRLTGGRVHLDGAWRSELPLPLDWQGAVRVELAFAVRSSLVVAGSGLSADFAEGVNFTESLAC